MQNRSIKFRVWGTLFLVLLYTAVWCRPLVPMIGYVLNQSAFAQDCENKSKPKMHCNGKCQAMKAAAKSVGQETETALPNPPENLLHLAEFVPVFSFQVHRTLADLAEFSTGTLHFSEVPKPPPRWCA